MGSWASSADVAVMMTAGVTIVVFVPWLHRTYVLYRRLTFWGAVAAAAVVATACGLIAFKLFPLPDPGSGFCSSRHLYDHWQLEPLQSFRGMGDHARQRGAWGFVRSSSFLQLALNVLLFVPVGLLVRYRFRLGLLATIMVGLGLSLTVEVVHGTGVLGAYPCPYRVADVDDLLTNTAGAAVGWPLGVVAVHLLPPSPSLPCRMICDHRLFHGVR